MRAQTPDEHLERLIGLEQELDELYGELGLPRPRFGELSVQAEDGAEETLCLKNKRPELLSLHGPSA